MDKQENIIFAFDLDGTIADYGMPVANNVATHLNQLGSIHIVTGGDYKTADKNTKNLTNKTIHAIREWRGNKSIDCSQLLDTSKKHFLRSSTCQSLRRNLCLALREVLHERIYIGGRSTIDIMPMRHKGQVIQRLQANGSKVIYFYDCRWAMNEEINNDIPAIKEAWKSVRTSHDKVIGDLRECLKTLT